MRKDLTVAAAGGMAWMLLVTTSSSAEPLRDVVEPLCSSLEADFADGTPEMSPNCSAPATGGRHDVLDISLTAARGPAQIGDFSVANAYLYNGRYIPEVWRLDPGDKLKIDFRNDLDDGDVGFRTNLHTHGLIVSPNNAPGTSNTPLGDDVYALVYARDAAVRGHGAHDDHGAGDMVPIRNFEEAAEYLIPLPDDHPMGVFWYHPHPHEITGPQVIGGMSGIMAVGQVADYLALEQAEGEAALPGPVDEKILMLKDMQITRESGESGWQLNEEYDPANCEDPLRKEPGVCFADEDNAWLFSVNGQIHPTIEITEGVGQLWRIANVGADATYELQLVEVTDDGTEIPMLFQVISVDGVAVGREPGEKPLLREKLLVMPSARIEVLIAHPGTDGQARRAVLRTNGFGTGATPDVGDNWPAIDLAEVVFTENVAVSDEPSGFAFVDDEVEDISFSVTGEAAADAACPRLADGEVRVVAFDVPGFTEEVESQPGFAPPRGCSVGAEFLIMGNVVTRVTDESSFAAILEAYDEALDGKYAGPFAGGDQAYRGKCFDGTVDTCVPYPAVEDWWVVNASAEGHNFHIHQTRFQVLDVLGAGANFTPIPDALHDNYPVLAGQAIKVRIALNRPEQIGAYVYHCHILEHEDRGMMAAIEVREVQ
ncbi:MAG: multicopper oxidase domain-containing protein [Bauldia litoralis]